MGVVLMPGRILVEQPWYAGWIMAAPAWLLLWLGVRVRPWRLFMLALVIPLALAVVASAAFGVGVFEVRYLAVAAVPLTLLLVSALATLPPAPAPRWIVSGAIVTLAATGIVRHAEWRMPWREVTARLAAHAGPVYAWEGFTVLPLRYYAAIDAHQVAVAEIKAWPRAGTAPGWMVIRPATLPDSIPVVEQLRAGGFVVVDSFAVGQGRNAVKAWRFTSLADAPAGALP
jgi:hypothetical protein